MNAVSARPASNPGAILSEHVLYAVLPWRRTKRAEIKVLLVAPRGSEQWSLLSGLPSSGKTPRQAAMSEAFEQAGVVGLLDANPIGCYSSQATPTEGSTVSCEVAVYGLKVRGTLTHWPGSTQYKRRWFRLDDAIQAVSNAGLKHLLASTGVNDTFHGAARKAAA
ncbi:NUDIX hydrolase [Pseudaminobacter soli (ex Li et al. 2025)]|uniref:NUDIX hydrolase n=1 Tax=Pseudaminobacter soli (ex Li et al. 2025) TaxID=1295366 RepID=A0A2P7SKG1_9HYPH|nr:NUDIX domain-containing protein [Mesorhizobium soli]PSJ62964.1 NUDIX hydrolase [Mesorhizobium soli]